MTGWKSQPYLCNLLPFGSSAVSSLFFGFVIDSSVESRNLISAMESLHSSILCSVWISVRRSIVCDYSERSPGVVLHLLTSSISKARIAKVIDL